MNKTLLVAIVATLVVAGAGGFFAGMKYQQTKTPSFSNPRTNGQGPRGQFGQRAGNAGLRPVSGTVISQDADSLTVKLSDGSSKIVFLTEGTSINKTEVGSKDDLSPETAVIIFGSENADGSVTAQNIQLNPQFGGFNRGQ